MKNSTLGTINAVVLATLLAATGLATAQESKQGEHPRGDRAAKMLARFDADQDGKVTLEEFETGQADRFANADQNGDGSISRDEMVAAITARINDGAAERAERMTDRLFARHDADKDGLISAEEVPADRAAQIFARLDADGDGSIVLAEIKGMRRGPGGSFGKRDTE